MNSSIKLRKNSRKSMRYYCKVYMKEIMARNHKPILRGVHKGRKAQKERVVHPMRSRILKTTSKPAEKERSIIWKVSSKRSNPPASMGNPILGRKKRHGCWTLRNIFRFTTIPAT